MKLLVWLVVVINLAVIAYGEPLTKINEEQKQVLLKAYEYGKPYDLSWSLMAIAWKESRAGKWNINLQDPAVCPFMININTAIKRTNLKDTSFNRNVLAQELIDDFGLCAAHAVTELTYWRAVHGENYRKIWASYNGGYNYSSPQAAGYAQEIADIIKRLKVIFKDLENG